MNPRRWPRTIPKGLRPPAQGCEARATLGHDSQMETNPNGDVCKRVAFEIGWLQGQRGAAEIDSGSSGSCSTAKKLFHLRLHSFIHLDERRPGAFEAFAGEFLRRINAEFAAAGDFAGGVVEHLGRAFGEDAVA